MYAELSEQTDLSETCSFWLLPVPVAKWLSDESSRKDKVAGMYLSQCSRERNYGAEGWLRDSKQIPPN